ncbi:MAG: ATPase, partial [Lachnospiraceae bacterium]
VYIDNCKPLKLSPSKIVVQREEMEDLLRKLRKTVPEEVERYRKVISNKEEIERDAEMRAQDMLKRTQEKTNQLVSDNEIVSRANSYADEIVGTAVAQGQEIIDKAQMEANAYKEAAQQYLADMLGNMHLIISQCLDTTTKNTNKLIDSLNKVADEVQSNLDELMPPVNKGPEMDLLGNPDSKLE